jgi:hypothetical protein
MPALSKKRMRCKKIIIGFGSSEFSELEIDFTLRYLAQPKMLVVGTVITDLLVANSHAGCSEASCDGNGHSCVHKNTQRDRTRLYHYLQEQCKDLGAKSIIHQESGCTLEVLMHQTRYADLLVLSQETYLASVAGPHPLPVSKVLEACSCPVFVLPSQPADLEQVVMTFDGSARAMGGIKQFTYLLDGLAQKLPITILSTYNHNTELPASEEKLFIEYLKQHFSNVALHRLTEGSEHTLLSAVGLNERALVVVNNPSPKNLPMLKKLLYGSAMLHPPLRLYTSGAADIEEEIINV